MWLVTVVVRRYIDFIILLIPTPLVSVPFCSSIPTFCSLKKKVFHPFNYGLNGLSCLSIPVRSQICNEIPYLSVSVRSQICNEIPYLSVSVRSQICNEIPYLSVSVRSQICNERASGPIYQLHYFS